MSFSKPTANPTPRRTWAASVVRPAPPGRVMGSAASGDVMRSASAASSAAGAAGGGGGGGAGGGGKGRRSLLSKAGGHGKAPADGLAGEQPVAGGKCVAKAE